MTAELPEKRQDNFAHGDRFFVRLDVNVGNGSGTAVDEQFEDLIGCESIAVELPVIAAHGAVVAVLPSITGDFNDAAHKDLATKRCVPCLTGGVMKGLLRGV